MKVTLLDPSEVFRTGLWAVLSRHRSDMELLDSSGSADSSRIVASKPDLVLADLSIQPGNAVGLVATIRQLAPSTKVVVLTPQVPRLVVRQLVDLGACGVLPKTMPAQELLAAIDRVLKGQTVEPATEVTSHGDRPQQARKAKTLDSLSPRERQVFDLVVWGWSNKEAAAQLSISVKTIETHRGHINGKLGIRSSADVVRVAAFAGALQGAQRPEAVSGSPANSDTNAWSANRPAIPMAGESARRSDAIKNSTSTPPH